jgi:signal transduction histidine kinase
MNLHLSSAAQLAQEIDQLNDQAKKVVFTNPKEAEQLIERASILAQSGPFATATYQRGRAASMAIRCRCYVQYADYLQAIDYGKQALVLCEACALFDLLAETSGNVGYAYTRIGQYVDGLRYQLQQEQVALQYGYRKLEAAAYLGRGIIYSFIGDLPKAIAMEEACLAIYQEIGDSRGIAVSYTNLSYSYNQMGDPVQGLQCGFDSLVYATEPHIQDIAGITYTNIGRSYKDLKAFTEARAYLEKALTLAETTENAFVKLLAHWELGRLAHLENNITLGLAYLETALQEATAQEQKLYQYETHYTLSEIYTQLNDPSAALAHFRAFHTIRDEVVSLQNQARIGVLEVEHAVENAQREAARSKQVALEFEQQVYARTADLQAALLRERDLSQKLEIALSRESELQQLKNQLILTASHEFRTPLAIINLATGILAEHYDRLTPERRLHHWGRVQEQILYLTDMLQDIFTVNSANEIKPHFAGYQFDDFCRRLQTELAKVIIPIHLVQFTYAESTQALTTDFDLVKRILFNLTVNAIKFSDAAAPVLIRCTHTDNALLIQVTDQGIGIPQAEIERIFDLFYRASNVDTRRGIGLGLSVVQKIVQVLQGSVRPESPGVNQGSTFSITLPLLPVL